MMFAEGVLTKIARYERPFSSDSVLLSLRNLDLVSVNLREIRRADIPKSWQDALKVYSAFPSGKPKNKAMFKFSE